MSEWTLVFDGLFEPRYKPRGIATYGFLVLRDGEVVHRGKGLVAGPNTGGSANVAEFGALVAGLTWLSREEIGSGPVHVLGDSMLVCETVAGRWNLSSEKLAPFHTHARELVRALGVPVTITKVSRDVTDEADRLTREAYHEAAAANPEWGLGPYAKGRAHHQERASASGPDE